jgi:multiple sugar transport system substrate-binding protein
VRRRFAALALMGLATGCSSAPAPTEPVVLRVIMADDWSSAPVVGEVIDVFERDNPGVRVQIDGSPFSQIPEVVTSAIELGQPHDLAHWHAFAAAAAGIAEPLDDLWSEAGLTAEEYLPGALQDVTWEGGRFGVPLDTNALVLMVNGEQLTDAGLTVSDLATIGTFREAAEALVEKSDAEYALSLSASSWAAYGWIVAFGGDLLTTAPDDHPTFTFDDPATVEALDLMFEFVDRGWVPPPFASDLAGDAVASFATGAVSLHTSGSWDLPITRRALSTTNEIDDLEVLPLPQVDPDNPRTVLGGSSLFVPVGAPNRELAFDLMLALTEDAVAVRLAAEEGRLPARTRVFGDELFASTPDLQAFVEQLDSAIVMPLIAYPEVAAAFRDALEDILAQRSTPEEAMDRVQRHAERWLEGR